jgi:dienelactone hydrolase
MVELDNTDTKFCVQEAVAWFSQYPLLNGNGLGVIGVSKGAEIAIHMAAHNKEVGKTLYLNRNRFCV